MDEIWKDVPGFEGRYSVSNKGKVKSLNYGNTGKSRNLKPNLKKDGYYDVEIDLEARSSLKNESAYEIIVREMDKYNGIVEEHSILINNEKGTKEIKFQKQEDTKYLTIDYKSLYKSERRLR